MYAGFYHGGVQQGPKARAGFLGLRALDGVPCCNQGTSCTKRLNSATWIMIKLPILAWTEKTEVRFSLPQEWQKALLGFGKPCLNSNSGSRPTTLRVTKF